MSLAPERCSFLGLHIQTHTHGEFGESLMLSPDRWASCDGLPSPIIELDPPLFPKHLSSCRFSLLPALQQWQAAQLRCLGTLKAISSLIHFPCSLWKVYMCNRNSLSSALYWSLPINLASHKKVPWNIVQGHKSLQERWNLLGNKIPSFHLFPCLKDWISNQLWTLKWDGRGRDRVWVGGQTDRRANAPCTTHELCITSQLERLILSKPQFRHL